MPKTILKKVQPVYVSKKMAKGYKTLHKYQYVYEFESLNAVNGASNLRNGPKGSCKVEIEVPRSCSYILRVTDCNLNEVVDVDAEGNHMFEPVSRTQEFASAMEKHPLRFVVDGANNVKLYPEGDEPTKILNVKRGIISALAVPLLEEEKNRKMPTIHGLCKTAYKVNAKNAVSTDVTLNRDLSKCDHFIPQRDHTSPLALISGMHYPLSKLIKSSQTCNYMFDNSKKHMMSGACTEKHILLPFSHKGEYGFTNVGKQSLTLLKVSTHNERVFDHDEANLRGLPMEAAEDKSVVQDKNAVLAVLRELATLANGEKRAHLFQQLVGMVRGMKAETLSPAVQEALEVSGPLTYQVLAQCGTPECSSAIMQILRSFDSSAVEVDPIVFAMGLVPNPSALLVTDILSMAQYKQSKPILYALSNVVKRFYKAEGKVTLEIKAAADFAATQLGDCSGDQEQVFLVLRVIGNMAKAVGAASPALKSAVIQCINQPAASPEVQQAAIQVFRQTPVPEEGREVLVQALWRDPSPVQKRIAAYLVLMKDPNTADLAQLASSLRNDQDLQTKSFIISHLTNILESTAPETQELREKILNALQGNEVGTIMDPLKFSRNYKIGSVEGNMLFEGTSYLPKEVMLEMTLKAFGYDIDMVEVGLEGKGFEPAIDALFGENGFFPDTVLKTVYFISDKMPMQVNDVLKDIMPALKKDRMKRQASQNIATEIIRNFEKLLSDLKAQESPEAMVYLRLLGNELGYLKAKDVEKMAYSAGLMIHNVLRMFPTHVPKLMKGLMTSTDNEVFAHYIFMDNEFFLPTATGVPLKIALSGTFTPGIKGGLDIKPGMSEFSFMPSAGIEFVTKFGCHIPESVLSRLEMHTSLYHETGLTAKITMTDNQVKLTIPAPQGPTKVISITNKMYAVTSAEVKPIPSLMEDRIDSSDCIAFFAGMKYCATLQYSDAGSHNTAPYFPLTGDSKFAVEIHPTGDVTEYTATIDHNLLKDGDQGHEKVDVVRMVLKAEGVTSTEATATTKYNWNKNVLTTDIQVPDFDLEARLRMGVVDGSAMGKGTHSISLDLLKNNVPTLSLVGSTRVEAMKNAMLQVQLLVPLIEADATITANLKRDKELQLEFESDVKLQETNSVQKITFTYDDNRIVAEVKSDINSEIHAEEIQKMVNDFLDEQLGMTDMKVRHILTKSVETTNNFLEKYTNDIPYMLNLRVPEMPEIALPDKLFLNAEATAAYHFSNEHTPLPFGGISSNELNFPPFFGKAEVSTKVNSNLYNLEGSASAEKENVEMPSYYTKFNLIGSCPLELLSFKTEGSGLLARMPDDSTKTHVQASVSHRLVDATLSIMEIGSVTDKINVKSDRKIEVTSPLGLSAALVHTGLLSINTEEISGDNNVELTIKAGPAYGKTIAAQSFAFFPFKPDAAKVDSSLKIDSSILQVDNTVILSLVNGELDVLSNTKVFEDIVINTAELTFRDNQLSLKCDTKGLALGMKINNKADFLVGSGAVKITAETKADHSKNEIYSIFTALLDINGLIVTSDATVKLLENKAAHKASLIFDKDGLVTTGTTSLQGPFTMENTFNVRLDTSRATLSIETKSAFNDVMVENANSLTVTHTTLGFNSKAKAIVSQRASYAHDITIDLSDYTASVNVNNDLKLLAASLIHEAQLKAEINKIDLTGILKASYAKEELKHTYEIKYADLTANVKCGTTGKLLGAHMSHNTELEMIGLAARIHNNAQFNSRLFRFDNTIRASIIPFGVNLDMIFNADGDLTLYGRHSAQLYGKFLLKAQPLAFASSHECRASITQNLDNGFSLETTLDNKMDMLVSPEVQEATLRVRSKVNSHTLNQDMKAYNNPDKLGLELSGTLITSLLDTADSKDQEFRISGFLKYDKNIDSHIIHLPFLESLPAILQDIKNIIVRMAEALQNYMNNENTKAKLNALPQHVSDFVVKLDLEGKVVQLKQDLIKLSHDYVIKLEDLEGFLVNYKTVVENLLIDMVSGIQEVIDATKEIIISGLLSENVIQRLSERLNAINENYEITTKIVALIDAIENFIKQIDMQKLKHSSVAFLLDIDAQFEIKAKLENAMSDLKRSIENLDRTRFIKYVRDYISSFNLEANVEQLLALLPTEYISKTLESVKELIQDSQIIGSVNAFHAKLRKIIVKYDVDKKLEVLLEKFVELIKQFKIKETIQVLVNNLKAVDIPGKVMQILAEAIKILKTTEISEVIDKLNLYLNSFVHKLKSFDYNAFVDEVNRCIAEYTTHVNKLIKALEIPEKLEAFREFVNFVITSAVNFIDNLRDIRIVDMVKTLRNIVYHDILNEKHPGFIVEFETLINELDDVFRDLKLSYLPKLPEIALPEFTLSEISFPALPKVAAEKLLKIPTLQIPKINLPAVPSEFMVPCFGKLYSEIKVKTAIFSMTTSAELMNTTVAVTAPQFTVFLTSQAESPSVEILNYNFDSTTRVAFPKQRRVILTETLKFTHSALTVEHQSSVTIYGRSSQGSAKTTVKATTAPYNADIVNSVFFAIGGGMSASMDTTYNHKISLSIITSEASMKQKAVAKTESRRIALTVVNDGTIKMNSDEGTHKSELQFTMASDTAKLKITSNTDTGLLKMKQSMNTEAVMPSHISFDIRSEAEGPAIKNSLLVASGNAKLEDIMVELKANHNSELVGSLSGILSNSFIFMIRPTEVVFDFQNKGNTKLSFDEGVVAKMDLQNDYSANINPKAQKINTVAIVRFNQYKSSYNFTVGNNEREAAIIVALNGEANLDFLTYPFTIPELDLPFINMHTPEVGDVNLYENIGLKHVLITTEQSLDVDAKITYRKLPLSYLGNLLTELSLKSPMLNLNANGEINTEDDLVFRLRGTTASVYESLKAKLDCITSLTTTRGLKLATALSLQNPLIGGIHESTISLNTDNDGAAMSVATSAKIAMFIINLEANQRLVADTKNKLKVAYTLKLKGDYNVPIIRSVGMVEAEHSLRLEGASEYLSVESSTKGNIDGTIQTHNTILGALENEAVFYCNGNGLRSTSTVIASASFKGLQNTVFMIDLNETIALEASSGRVYGLLKVKSNNDANIITFKSKGIHVAQATVDFVPWKSLTSDYEISISQQSNAGDIAILEKCVVDLKCYKQTISAAAKITTPVYTTDVAADLEVDAPVVKATLKSSATSAIDFLDYDVDASITINVEEEALGLTGKVMLTHTDLTINIQNVITQAIRKKRQDEGSVSRQTLNVDITSPTFTDVNFRYTAQRDGVSASISNPSSGFLGLQLQGRSPSLLSTRLYSRYPSAPEDDVDILVIRTTADDGDKIKLQVAYNMEAPNDMLLGLKERLPLITSTLTNFLEKYQIFGHMEGLKRATINLIEDAYITANRHAPELSQLSVLFRNTVVQYQKAVQVFLDAAIKILRETQFKLPGSEEMTTLPEVLKQFTITLSIILQHTIEIINRNVELCFTVLIEMFSKIQIRMPIGNVMTGGQILDQLKVTKKEFLDRVTNLINNFERLDTGLVELSKTLEFLVEKAQVLVDNMKFDYLDDVAVYVNDLYVNFVAVIKTILDTLNTLNMEQVNRAVEHIIEMVMSLVTQFNLANTGLLDQSSEEAQAFTKVSGGKLEINLPFPFQQ
ncbi:apolipoprotein B-100 isoform X2 [Esox lucius]|uniref:apolipoprotein B-100 isoform X2 n=1 Tax=Esox lucius TaxID=8010 RepID=UPI001476BB71|nr:apolipoprotein B-100 isoform X2 [Esox lucius]